MMTVGGCAVIFDFASVARRTGPRSSDVEGFFGDRQFFVQRWGFPIASSKNPNFSGKICQSLRTRHNFSLLVTWR